MVIRISQINCHLDRIDVTGRADGRKLLLNRRTVMKKRLILLVVISLLLISCVKIVSTAPSDNDPDKAPDVTGGLAQKPGDLQSLPGMQSGSQSGNMSGFSKPTLPPGTPVSPAIGQFNLSGQGGSQPSGMGELQIGGQSGGSGGNLPVIQSGGSTETMSGFKAPPSNSPSMPASAPVEKLPFFEKELYADTQTVNVGEAVFLGWIAANADEYNLEQDGKVIQTVPRDRVGTFVTPGMPGTTKYTLTAKNSGRSVSLSVEVNVLSRGQRPTFDRSKRCRTFMVYPKIINKGEPVYVYWNVLDAQNVFIDNNFTGNISREPDVRDLMNRTYGMEQYWPYVDTDFRLTHGSGPYSSSTYWADVCYVDVR
jgi:hypothetical protein